MKTTKLIATLTALTLTTSLSTVAFAYSQPSKYNFQQMSLMYMQNSHLRMSTTQDLVFRNTDYVSLYKMNQLLGKLAYNGTWDYATKTWDFNANIVKNVNKNYDKQQKTGLQVKAMNGTIMTNIPFIIAKYPDTTINTIFIPFSYFKVLYNYVG